MGSFQALETYIICKLVLFSVCQADWWEPSYRFLLSTYDYMEQVGALQATFQPQQLITHLWLTALGVPMRLRITAVSQHPNINRVFPFRCHLQLSLKLLENTGFLALCLERVWESCVVHFILPVINKIQSVTLVLDSVSNQIICIRNTFKSEMMRRGEDEAATLKLAGESLLHRRHLAWNHLNTQSNI